MIEAVGGVGLGGRPQLFGLARRSLVVRAYRGIGSGGYLVPYEILVRVCRGGVGMQDHLHVAIVSFTCPASVVPQGGKDIQIFLDRLGIH